MKNRIFYIMLLLVSVLACSDEFSETIEIGTLNPEALANEDGINFLLTAAYSGLDGVTNASGGWEATGDNWWMDVISDDAHKGSNDGDQQTLFLLEVYDWNTGNSYLNTKWRALYAGANRANAVISLILGQGVEVKFASQLAEARFLRGHFNFQLQIMWGQYATYISDENYVNTEFSQQNGTPLWAAIDADFDFAVKNLPDNQGDFGRATTWAAQAYWGKSKLYQGEFSDALGAFQGVINGGKYSLLPEYGDNFKVAGEGGSENVFAIEFSPIGGAFAPNGNQGGTLNYQGPNGWCCGFYQPTQDLVNAFQTSGGLPLLDDFNKTDVKNDAGLNSGDAFTMHTGTLDPRVDYTAGRRGINYNNWDIAPGKDWIRAGFSDISGPYLGRKSVYWAGEDSQVGAGGWGEQRSGINYHFIRYADVLLMAAEAAVETNDLATALDYVNQVRARAIGSTPIKAADGSDAANYEISLYASLGSQDEARKAVRMERRLELGMEGHRLFDLRRWNVLTQTITDYVENEARTIPNFGPKFKGAANKHNLFPVPIGAIDQSSGTLGQNPEWGS